MPSQVVFPCPNCGASQSVEEGTVSTQCQFCGNTVAVPEELRPKTPPPAPAAPATPSYSFGNPAGVPGMSGMPGMPGMTGMPGMFLNMDISKLKAMAMAARAGDKTEAARLYSEAFGVSPEQAMQAAELMATHHPLVLSQMQMGNSAMMQLGGTPPAGPYAVPGATYNLPSPPVVSTGQRAAGRMSSCCSVALTLFIILVIVGAIAVGLLATSPNLLGSIVSLFSQGIKH
jgi:hypothetical protein